MIRCTLNGDEHELVSEINISELLRGLHILKSEGVAVAVNGAVIPKSEHPNVTIKEGDSLEVIHAVGGG